MRATTVADWLRAIAIVVLICALLSFRWVAFALSRGLAGSALPLFESVRPDEPWVLCSFGAVVAALLLLSVAAVLLAKPRVECALGAAAFILLEWAYLRLSVGDTRLLLEAFRQSDWWLIIAGSPPRTAVVDPAVWRQLYFDTLSDRLFSGWQYLGLGWYAGLTAALCAFVGGASALGARSAARIGTIAVASAMALALVYLIRPIMAQQDFGVAMRTQTEGRALDAVELYRRAIALDSWYSWNPRIYERIGAAYASIGQTSHPEYKIYEAERIFAANQGTAFVGNLPDAIELYDSIVSIPGSIGAVATMRGTDLRVLYGLHLFQVGAFGSAVGQWETALNNDDQNWLSAFYLGRGYPTVNRYQDLIRVSRKFADQCGDPLAAGVFYNSLGDAYSAIGEFAAAHQAYFNSYHVDYIRNRPGLSALVGP
jgi:hypothetical protein